MPSSNSSSDSRQRARKSGMRVVSTDVHSGTDRAIGPAWSKLGASGKQPSSGTRPWLGLKPTTPHHAAGIRIEPPESVPRAASASPAASAAAEPPLEPPARRPGATGFGTVPKCGFCDEIPYANSWRFVLPTVAYPAASSRATASAVRSGTRSANTIQPYVVTSPAVSNRSLTASGIPSAGRSGRARKIDTPVIIRRRPDRGSVPGPTRFRQLHHERDRDHRRAGLGQSVARRRLAPAIGGGVEAEVPTIELGGTSWTSRDAAVRRPTDCWWQEERKPSDPDRAPPDTTGSERKQPRGGVAATLRSSDESSAPVP
jgi:hypothetical protein